MDGRDINKGVALAASGAYDSVRRILLLGSGGIAHAKR
jgi:hypothetical protein